MKRLDTAFNAVLAVAAAVVAIVLVRREFFPSRGPVSPGNAAALVSKVEPELWQDLRDVGRRVAGAQDGPTVVVLSDYECPACRSFEELVARMLSVDSALFELRIVHTPLGSHRFAGPSARFAECAAEGGQFSAAHRLLFAVQDSLGLIAWSALADRIGLPNAEAIAACATADDASSRFQRIREGARLAERIAFEGTPTVVAEGRKFHRPPSEQQLRALFDSVRAERIAPR